MSWTGRDDSNPCCGDDPGPVAPEETVARLLHSGIVDPPTVTFRRDDLHPRQPHACNNTCGESDGLSVDRCAGLEAGEIQARALAQAKARPGRTSAGALTALVSELRELRSEHDPRGRAVYVYDDPRPGNKQHSVIRVSEAIPRSDFHEVRDQIMKLFAGRIAP